MQVHSRNDDNLIPYHKDGKWGFVNEKIEVVIQPFYDSVSVFKNSIAIVKVKGKFGLIDTSNKYVVKPKFKSISLKWGGTNYLAVKTNGKKSYFNLKGEKLKNSPGIYGICGHGVPNYLYPQRYSTSNGEKMALIYRKEEATRFLDVKFIRDTTDFSYSSIEPFDEDSFIIEKDGKKGIWIPNNLYIKTDFTFDDVIVQKSLFQNTNLHIFKRKGLFGLIDINGNIIVGAKYRAIEFDHDTWHPDNFIKVEFGENQFGYISPNGKEYF